jgi:hypothetical protein
VPPATSRPLSLRIHWATAERHADIKSVPDPGRLGSRSGARQAIAVADGWLGLPVEPQCELGAGQDGGAGITDQACCHCVGTDDGKSPVIEGDQLWQ